MNKMILTVIFLVALATDVLGNYNYRTSTRRYSVQVPYGGIARTGYAGYGGFGGLGGGLYGFNTGLYGGVGNLYGAGLGYGAGFGPGFGGYYGGVGNNYYNNRLGYGNFNYGGFNNGHRFNSLYY